MTLPTGPYFVRGVSQFVFCPAVADLTAPTRTELTAGTVLTGITNVSGFQIKRSFVDTPDLDSDFTSNIAGERKADSSSLTFKDKRSASAAIRTALAEGTSGIMVFEPWGDIVGAPCECWPVTSGGVNRVVDMGSYAQFTADFATPEPPEQNGVLPATT
jgi:hypothetical protein